MKHRPLTRSSRSTASVVLGLLAAFWTPPAAAQTSAKPAPPRYKGIFEPVNYPADLRLTDVFFVSEDVGWVTGEAGTILHTTDGGATWSAQLGGDPESKESTIQDLHFLDETHGWATRETGAYQYALLRTADGENWEQVGTFPTYVDYVFTSETDAFAIVVRSQNSGYLWRSQDGGLTWNEVATCETQLEVGGLMQKVGCNLLSLHFPSRDVGYAVGGKPQCGGCGGPPLILKTEDGGASWNISVGPGDFATSTLHKVLFLDDNTGFLRVAQGDKLFLTADGGQSWKGLVGSPGPSVKFADPEVGWSFDQKRLTYTTDGGKRWSARDFAFPATPRAFSLPRRDRGYVVGDHGMIYRYRVVPVTETIPKAIDAPAMPAFDSPLDDQVNLLATGVDALVTRVELAAQVPPAEGAAGEPLGGGEIAGQEKGWVADCCAQELGFVETGLMNVSSELPQFSGRLRNLNLVIEGLQRIGQLFSQTQGVKDAFASVRDARDPQSAATALAELASQVDALSASTRAAFQQD